MRIQGRQTHLERPGKRLWPEAGVTKAGLARYLLRASARMLPHLRDRPLTLVRMPDGVHGPVFYQKDTPSHVPKWIPRYPVETKDRTIEYIIVNEPAALVVLADQAVGELHAWVSNCRDVDRPDRVVFDLDPPDPDRLPAAVEGAREIVRVVASRGGTPFAMATGSRGLHVVVPLVPRAPSTQVNAFADAVGRHLVRRRPDAFTMEVRKAARGAKVYVDTLRNRRNQTSVVPYSPRVRREASVAAPVPLAALQDDRFDPRARSMTDAELWLRKEDPWRGFFDAAVPLGRLI